MAPTATISYFPRLYILAGRRKHNTLIIDLTSKHPARLHSKLTRNHIQMGNSYSIRPASLNDIVTNEIHVFFIDFLF